MREILVIPNISAKDLSLHTDLCGQFEAVNCRVTLVVPPNLSTFIPSSFRSRQRRLLQIQGDEYGVISASLPEDVLSTPQQVDKIRRQVAKGVRDHLADRSKRRNKPRLICALIDLEMGQIKALLRKFNIPVLGFLPFGACAAVLEWSGWNADVVGIESGEERLISGLPQEGGLSFSDFKLSQSQDLPLFGGEELADQPLRPPQLEGLDGLMLNTCRDLERPFIDYLTKNLHIRVWCVGPLLGGQPWKGQFTCMNLFAWVVWELGRLLLGIAGAKVGNTEGGIRREPHQSPSTEKVRRWLVSKPRRSVLYVAFGGNGEPTTEECQQLVCALEESTLPFILVINHGSRMSELINGGPLVGDRGLIIHGSAPHLSTLRHPSAGGFLTNCEWNSMAAAIRCGLPILAWPSMGNHCNAKLVVTYLKVGYLVAEDLSMMVQKEDIVQGIEMLMADEEMRVRAGRMAAKIKKGIRASSKAALDALEESVNLIGSLRSCRLQVGRVVLVF